jgi:hypothetical protein
MIVFQGNATNINGISTGQERIENELPYMEVQSFERGFLILYYLLMVTILLLFKPQL